MIKQTIVCGQVLLETVGLSGSAVACEVDLAVYRNLHTDYVLDFPSEEGKGTIRSLHVKSKAANVELLGTVFWTKGGERPYVEFSAANSSEPFYGSEVYGLKVDDAGRIEEVDIPSLELPAPETILLPNIGATLLSQFDRRTPTAVPPEDLFYLAGCE